MTTRDDIDADLAHLVRQIHACRLCRDAPRGAQLPHEPRPILQVSTTARIALCGQAPGTRVHASGKPFTDASGDRLRAWTGLESETFYDSARVAVVPMGFCFPGLDAKGADLPPRRECAPTWHHTLFATLPRIELVVLIGGHAQAWHLGNDRQPTVTETVADWRRIFARPGPRRYLPVPHPSWRNTGWLRRHPWFEADVVPFLRNQVQRVLLK